MHFDDPLYLLILSLPTPQKKKPILCNSCSSPSCIYRSLYLEGNLLGALGTTKLAQLMLSHQSLPNLAELNLKACQITDEGMRALAEGLLVKRNIRKLDLRYFIDSSCRCCS